MFQKKTPFIHGCTQGSKVLWGRPTNCCCKHTHVCMAESHVNSRLAPRIKKVQEFGRPTAAASIHICVLQKKKGLNPRTKACQGCGKPSAAYTCVFQKNSSRLHPRVKGYTGLADQLLLRAYTCVLQDISIQGCTCKCVSVKGYNSLADQLLLREHTCDMCVAEKTNSGLVWPTTS